MDQKTKKEVLRKITYGIYILAVENAGVYSAATITWLSQASFKPPLLMIGLKNTSNIYNAVVESKKFSINFLNDLQKDMAASFFKNTKYENGRLNGYEIENGKTGVPIFKKINSIFECVVKNIIEGGDHNIIIAEIKDIENRRPGYHEEIQDVIIEILNLERIHRIQPTNIQQQINEKIEAAGRFLCGGI